MIRSAGILLSLTSLPSPYGIGTMGKDARDFVDFLADAGQTYWQILPIGPTGYGNSPYQALSSYAGNPYLIDLDELIKDGLLEKEDLKGIKWQKKADHVDYGILYNERTKILHKAAERLTVLHPQEYLDFISAENYWLKEFAVFMAIKDDQKGKPWTQWPEELRRNDYEAVRREAERLKDSVLFYERVQYLFYKQYKALKKYANDRGILIIGDLPFYISADSSDVWAHPEHFEMDGNHRMTFVSGMAPDGGNPKGQKWGNPLINWDRLRNEGFGWWIGRVDYQMKLCDVLRIDHFKGYESYFAVPAEDPDASRGHWRRGPGLDCFREMVNRIGWKQLILEDLGHLTQEFIQMVKDSGYPGMRIMQYAFDPNDPGSLYMPFQYEKNTVVYTGTHDNDTLTGWKKDKNNKARIQRCEEYLNITGKDFTWPFLSAVYATVSDLAIVQMQDLLELDSSARLNDPTGATPAWTWRMTPGCYDEKLSAKLKEKMLLYCRNNWNVKPKKEQD